MACPWTPTDIQGAFASLKRHMFCDTYGHCIHMLAMVPENVSEVAREMGAGRQHPHDHDAARLRGRKRYNDTDIARDQGRPPRDGLAFPRRRLQQIYTPS